jgi:anti-anti-sigma factor
VDSSESGLGAAPRRAERILDSFTIATEALDGGFVVRLQGELDLASAETAARELERVQASEHSPLTLDLSNLTFIDSTGIRLVLDVDKRGREAGGELRLIRGPDQIQRIFELTGLTDRLQFTLD